MKRRQFLTGAGPGLIGAGVAGCTGLVETRSIDREPPVLEDRPDAVYVPTHDEGMAMIGTGEAGDYTVGLTYSFPHRFWTVTGTDTERVDVREEDAVHLMATVWDDETGTVLPVGAGLSMELERDGQFVAEKSPWPMLSQTMGFHYGDNFALEGEGTYAVRVDVGAMGVRRFGAFEDRFDDRASATIDFAFDVDERDDLRFERLEGREGERGALDLMGMEMLPTSTVPAPEDLPGRAVGIGDSGDATVVVSALEPPPFVDEASDAVYLLVSPRTPHNRIPLPMASLSVAVERDGELLHEGPLREAIEPTAGYHYGAALEDLSAGDELTIAVDSPPQASRHEGYETAFVEMSAVESTVE